MSAFADSIEKQCIQEAIRVQEVGEQADLTHAVASALALTIALQAKGRPSACAVLLNVVIDELPEMLAKRADAVRSHLLESMQ